MPLPAILYSLIFIKMEKIEVNKVARMLSTTPDILRALARNGEFPAIGFGGWIDKAELSAWIQKSLETYPYSIYGSVQELGGQFPIHHFRYQNLIMLNIWLNTVASEDINWFLWLLVAFLVLLTINFILR
jgi:hypothetical protein